jgi:probable rRNA maturation factor
VEEAVVHGVLHLAGHDHETDGGDMLEVQRQVLAALRAG